jgi:hypothetical protein
MHHWRAEAHQQPVFSRKILRKMRFFAVFCWLIVFQSAIAQPDFEVLVRPVEFAGLPGMHSYAYAQQGDEVLLIGGRVEGLHNRLPGLAFAPEGAHKMLTVVNFKNQQFWQAGLGDLDTLLAAQLSATNFEFHQNGDQLLVIGGYGPHPKTEEFITWPALIQLRVSAVIEAVKAKKIKKELFQRIDNEQFAVTGGQLRKLDSTYLLIGGHRFEGVYNPLNGPSFVQTYTNAVRRFRLQNGQIQWLPELKDSILLHRRDLNVVNQTRPDGSQYITVFSGVFQRKHDFPYLNAVHISENAIEEQPNFAQYFNHYHCPTLPVFDSKSGEMHTFFFGGIAQYLWRKDTLIQDNEVPFTRAISCVTRTHDGVMTEYQLPIKMPALLGAGAEFLRLRQIPHPDHKPLQINDLTSDTTWVGLIYGGIESEDGSVFWYDDLSSKASTRLFEVGIVRNKKMDLKPNPFSTNGYQIQVYPDLEAQAIAVHYNLPKAAQVQASLYKKGGGLVMQTKLDSKPPGKQSLFLKTGNALETGVFHLKLEIDGVMWDQRVYLTP